jgi:acetyl esterase/lipase
LKPILRRILRLLGWGLAGLFLTALVAHLFLRRGLPSNGTAPRGYGSRQEIIAALLVRGLVMIPREPPLPPGVIEERDVEYGRVGDRSLQLDVYRPAQSQALAPALIFIHGGAWRTGKRSDYRVYTTHFAAEGYVAVTASYRLFREATFPAALQDVKCAVRWVRANAARLQVDPERIAVVGGSAGGHLALLTGYTPGRWEDSGGQTGQSSRVAAVVDIYGPADLTTAYARETGVVKDFLGCTFEEDAQRWRDASPLLHVSSNCPPTLVLQGTLDELVPVEQSDRLVERLRAVGVPCEYERLEGWPHTMDAVEPMNTWFKGRMGRFFATHLRKP